MGDPLTESIELAQWLRTLRVHGGKGQPTRHQGIVLLWAAGRARMREPRLVRWSEVRNELSELLAAFGHAGSHPTPEFPFLALCRAGWWELSGTSEEPPPAHSSQALRWLNEHDPYGGLPATRYGLLMNNDEARGVVVGGIVNKFFGNGSGGFQAVTSLLKHVQLDATATEVTGDGWDLAPGDVLKRLHLHERFGGQRQGGVSTPRGSARVFVFTNPEGEKYGYRYDGWQPDGSYHYTGQGTKGDQTFTSANHALVDANRELHVFREAARSVVIYIGQFRVDAVNPYRHEDAPDEDNEMRNVLVFHLWPVSATSHVAQPHTAATEEYVSWEIPIEARNVQSFAANPATGPTQAERREARLVGRYAEWLHNRGHEACRHVVVIPGKRGNNYTDLFDKAAEELVEAKGSSARPHVRMALGQLLDYGRYVAHASKAVLLPTRPASDLVGLLASHGIACVYETEHGNFERVSPGS